MKRYLNSMGQRYDLDQRTTRVYETGERLFCQNDEPLGLFCLQSGHVLLWHIDAFGYKTSFRVVGPGELIGYRSVLGEDNHAATAEALTTCHACFYPRTEIESLIRMDYGFARQMFRLLALDRGPPDALLLRGQHLSARVRLVYLLLVLKDQYGHIEDDGRIVFDLPLSRADIGTLIGARPETVARAIKELQTDGVAYFHNRRVEVPEARILYADARVDLTPE